MNDLHRALPSKIDGTFDIPKISEMVMATSESHVRMFVEMELARLESLVNVSGNLNAVQIEHIAEQLVNDFPKETIADFKICFSYGASGRYGDIFRIDGIVINKWFRQYLDEKYQVLEDKLMKEKETSMYAMPEAPPVDQPNQTDWYQKWLDAVGDASGTKKVRQLTDEEIEAEGQAEPKRKPYPYDESEAAIRWREMLTKLERMQYQTVKERHPEFTEDQVRARVAELQNEIVSKSGTHSILPPRKKIKARY